MQLLLVMDEQRLAEEAGRRIREIREAKGMSPNDLAKAVGVWYNTIKRIEKGEFSKRPNMKTMSAIARALGVPLTDIFPDDEEKSAIRPKGHKAIPEYLQFLETESAEGMTKAEADFLLSMRFHSSTPPDPETFHAFLMTFRSIFGNRKRDSNRARDRMETKKVGKK